MSYTVLWFIWLAMFLAIEGAALFNKRRGDTLSEHVWHWFDIYGKPKGWQYRRASLAAFLVWLLFHFMGVLV